MNEGCNSKSLFLFIIIKIFLIVVVVNSLQRFICLSSKKLNVPLFSLFSEFFQVVLMIFPRGKHLFI